MKTLTVRRIPDQLHHDIRMKAAERGLSMEEEARRRLAGTQNSERLGKAYDPARAAAARARLWKMFEGLEGRQLVDEFLVEKKERARRELSR